MSINPSPMPTRPRSRVADAPVRNMATPARISRGVTWETSNDSNCTMIVVPTFAPSMVARAGVSATMPLDAKEATIRPVAVLL